MFDKWAIKINKICDVSWRPRLLDVHNFFDILTELENDKLWFKK